MSELKQILSLVIISLLVATGLILLAGALPGVIEGDLVVGHYNAVLTENGTLSERYDFVVKNSGEYRMLFRFWEAPLLTTSSDKPYIQFVSLANPPGTTGYIKDAGSSVTIVGNGGDPAQKGKIQHSRNSTRWACSNHHILTRGLIRSKQLLLCTRHSNMTTPIHI